MDWASVYVRTISHLSTQSLYGEVLKLENSIKHLRRSNEELRVHGEENQEEKSWTLTIIEENVQVIKKQLGQIEYAKRELLSRGVNGSDGQHWIESEGMDGDNGITERRIGENGQIVGHGGAMDLDEGHNGIHL